MKLSLKELQDLETEMLQAVAEICEKHNIDYYLAYGTALGAVRHKGPIPWDNDADIALPNNQMERFLKVVEEELPDKFYLRYYGSDVKQTGFIPRIGLKGYSTKILHIDIYRITGAPEDKNKQKDLLDKVNELKSKMRYKNLKEGYFSFDKISLKAKIAIYLKWFQMLFISRKSLNKKFEALCDKYPYEDSELTVNIAGGYGLKEFIPKAFYGNGILMEYDGCKARIPEQYEEYLTHFYGDYMQFPPLEEQEAVKKNYHIASLK